MDFRQTKLRLDFLLFTAASILLLSACGSSNASNSSPSDAGALSFTVHYHGADINRQPHAAIIDCVTQGVATVEAVVYEPNHSLIQSGGPWDCDFGQGTIDHVPAGSGRIVVVLGKDADGNIVFRGEKAGINIVANSDNNTGTVDCYAFVPTLEAPADGGSIEVGARTLAWNRPAGETTCEYIVKVWAENDMSNPVIRETIATTSYAPIGVAIGETYFWQVLAVDSYGNTGVYSATWSFIVNANPVNTPPVAEITSPAEASIFTTNEIIAFSGTGTDSEDGDLDGASLVWGSDQDGQIGDGKTLTSDALSGGNHQITLTVTDNEGAEGTATVAITVIEGSVPPGTIKPSAVVDGTEITLNWNTLADTTAYNIYWSTTPDVSTTNYEGTFQVSDRTNFTHTLLTHGTAYHYVITAENAFGEGAASMTVVAVAGMEFDWYPITATARGYGVAVAKDGSIYWSGETLAGGLEFPNTNFLIKQKPGGYRYWTQSIGVLHPYTASMGGGNSIALDDLAANQNCYIAGHTFENIATSGRDIFVEKYSSTGVRTWSDIISTPASDHAYDIAVYSNNAGPQYDTYITGFVSGAVGSDTFAGATDIIVAKYNQDGVRLWTRTMGTDQWDVGYAIALDRYGHPYITGRTWGNLTGQGSGIFVAKYNSDSSLWWSKTIQAEGADSGYGHAIAVDQYGNAYVTGYVGTTSSRKIILAKFNDNGDELWTKIIASSNSMNSLGIALDAQEAVYIAGYAEGNVNAMLNQGNADILVAKFDAYGEQQWLRIFGGPGDDVAERIILRDNICYIAGHSNGSLNGSNNITREYGDDAFLLQVPLD